jgi:polar amino acid transport system ATP-binding protein
MDQSKQVLAATAIEKRFGACLTVNNVSLRLWEGETLGLIGPSGGGKTTLLRCLGLLEHWDQGEISYFDRSVVLGASEHRNRQEVANLRRRVGFVFQDLKLWDHLTVLENLCLAPKRVLRQSDEEVRSRAVDLCNRLQIKSKIKDPAWQLSVGQRQRVAIARALMMEPELIFLDEVTSALDPILAVEIMDVVEELCTRNKSVILVTHHLEFASSVCDRVVFLDHGRIVQEGIMQDLREHPATEAVGRFFSTLDRAR